MPLDQLIAVLQVAIGPVILLSGVGLLLLTLTNRFGRAVDRSRQLVRELREVPAPEQERLASQVDILYERARLIRLAITLATVSVLLAAALIICLFLSAFTRVEGGLFISVLFIGCMLALIGSMLAFLKDIHVSLVALKLELGLSQPQGARPSEKPEGN